MRKHGNSQTTFSGSGIGNAAVITCAIIILWSILQVTQGFGIFTDDPFISFRYARNIANGHGAVFNTGHRVEGYSNFLWVLILAGIIRLGGDPVVASKWIGCLCNLATLTLIILYSRRLLSRTWTLWIAPVCLACNIDFIRWGGGGLETPLYVLCITASFAWIWYRHPAVCSAAGIAAAGAALTRPEGIIAGPLMAGAVWWVFRRNSAPKTTRTATATLCAQRIFDWWLLIVIPYHLWRITYFGEILPNTFYCKVSCIRTSWAHGIMYVADFFRSNGHLVLLTGAATGCISRWQRLWPLTVLGLILTGMVVLEGGDWMPYHRFMLPILPILLLLFAAGCETCRNRFTASPGVATVTLLIAVAFLLCQPLIPHSNAITAGFTATRHILMGNSPSKGLIQEPVSRITSNDETWLLGQRAAGEWLGANARPGASLALGAAGVIPYYSGLRTVDFFGLVTPSVARGRKRSGWSMAGHQKYDREIILDVEPDYIVFSGTADPSREPRWWLRKFKLLDCPEFRDNYVYRMVDIGTCRFGYYERIAPATAQNDP